MTGPAMAPVADCEVRKVVLAVLPRNAISWTLRPPILQHFERVNFRSEPVLPAHGAVDRSITGSVPVGALRLHSWSTRKWMVWGRSSERLGTTEVVLWARQISKEA